MDTLPTELIKAIIFYLDPIEIAQLQLVSWRFLQHGRDFTIWKRKCFERSSLEASKRWRDLAQKQATNLAALRQAWMDNAQVFQMSETSATSGTDDSSTAFAASQTRRRLANWDPGFMNESPDWYTEYIARHAKISVDWLQPARIDQGRSFKQPEPLGVGILESGSDCFAQNVVASFDDGSVRMWTIAQDGRVQHAEPSARSSPDLLSPSGKKLSSLVRSTDIDHTGATETVSVDDSLQKAYIGVMDELHEVDLRTLQVTKKQAFPFPISCLSKAIHPTPLTIGTSNTLHLYDFRQSPSLFSRDTSVRCELIGGSSLYAESSIKDHVTLSQPGPLSIIHLPTHASDDIWVAGRFTSLLNYDRRYWPRIRTTLHSGARLSSLSLLHHPYVPSSINLLNDPWLSLADLGLAKSIPGHTLLAAGEYRGKGSLELYGFYDAPAPTLRLAGFYKNEHSLRMQNRQTVSRTRLLSVCPHGTRLVFSDGDGNVKWVERNGMTPVRSFNINDTIHDPPAADRSSMFDRPQAPNDASSSEVGDIVQRIMPIRGGGDSGGVQTNFDDLLLWTADGRLGFVGFRNESRFCDNEYGGIVRHGVEENVDDFREQKYRQLMRRALEQQADAARVTRGLGQGW